MNFILSCLRDRRDRDLVRLWIWVDRLVAFAIGALAVLILRMISALIHG